MSNKTELKLEALRPYFLYGDIQATIVSDKTGNSYSVHVKKVNYGRYYCEYLPDDGLATFAGLYDPRHDIFYVSDDYMLAGSRDMPMWLKAIRYTMLHLTDLPHWIHVYVTHCPRCGKKLTSEWSLSHGFGERCYKLRRVANAKVRLQQILGEGKHDED